MRCTDSMLQGAQQENIWPSAEHTVIQCACSALMPPSLISFQSGSRPRKVPASLVVGVYCWLYHAGALSMAVEMRGRGGLVYDRPVHCMIRGSGAYELQDRG